MKRTYRRPTMCVDGKQMLVSRVVMARYLERPLKTSELVHHINHNPFDNRIENLQIVSRSEHKKLHPEIGVSTRLKKKWVINPDLVVDLFKTETSKQIASRFGCSEKTITRLVKSKICGDLRTQRGLRTKTV